MNWQGSPIRQNGVVVTDIRAAMEYWTVTMGVGPFFHIEDQPLIDFRYRGELSPLRMQVALAQSGGIQIELIQQVGDAPSAFRDFSVSRGEGLQHVAYWTEDFDAATAEAQGRGLVLVQGGRSGSGGPNERFAYYETPDAGKPMIEISETLGRKARLFAAVAAASEDWDGSDPIRPMMELFS